MSDRTTTPEVGRVLTTEERDGLVRLLNQIDGQLGLAVYRGEGSLERWKQEASELITRARSTAKALHEGGPL